MIGVLTFAETGVSDTFMSDLALYLSRQGIGLAGAVQINDTDADGAPQMALRLLPDGPVLSISQRLGRAASGCRLDPDAFTGAVARIEENLTARPQLLLLNKFGKEEAAGSGFRTAIATAIAQSIPVILTVPAHSTEAFHAFAGEFSENLPADLDTISTWVKTQIEHG